MAITRFAGTPTEASVPAPGPSTPLPAIEVNSTPFVIDSSMNGRQLVVASGLDVEMSITAGLPVGYEVGITFQAHPGSSFVAPEPGGTIRLIASATQGPDVRAENQTGNTGEFRIKKLASGDWQQLNSTPNMQYESLFNNLISYRFANAPDAILRDIYGSFPPISFNSSLIVSFWLNGDEFAPAIPAPPGTTPTFASIWDENVAGNRAFAIDYFDDVTSNVFRVQLFSASAPGVVAKDWRWDVDLLGLNSPGWHNVFVVMGSAANPQYGDTIFVYVDGSAQPPTSTPTNNPVLQLVDPSAFAPPDLVMGLTFDSSLPGGSILGPASKQVPAEVVIDEVALWFDTNTLEGTTAVEVYNGGLARDLSALSGPGVSPPDRWYRLGDLVPGVVPGGPIPPLSTFNDQISSADNMQNGNVGEAEPGVPTA